MDVQTIAENALLSHFFLATFSVEWNFNIFIFAAYAQAG